MRKRPALAVLVVCLVVGVGPELREILEAAGTGIPPLPFPYGRSLLYNLLAVAIALGAAAALRRKRLSVVAPNLGLRWSGFKGPTLTLLATVPCWVGLGASGKLSTDFTTLDLLFPAVVFPFAEELVFRGFGFIFTRRTLGWPMLVSVLLQALVFGLDHWIGAGASGAVALQVLLLTALGGIFFAVLDIFGDYTIWNGWVWHGSVNAAWTVFAVSDTAAAGWLGNGLRFGSLGLALLLLYIGGRRPGR